MIKQIFSQLSILFLGTTVVKIWLYVKIHHSQLLIKHHYEVILQMRAHAPQLSHP